MRWQDSPDPALRQLCLGVSLHASHDLAASQGLLGAPTSPVIEMAPLQAVPASGWHMLPALPA